MEGRHLPPSPSRYFFFFLAAFFFFAIRKSPPFRCNRPTQPSPRRSPRLRLVGHRLDSNVEYSTSASAGAPSSWPSCASSRSSSSLSSSWKRHLPSPP